MSGPDNRTAWADFWSARSEASAPAGVPEALSEIEEAQCAVWKAYALELPRAARVLDLATGDGAVLKTMREVRPDLRLTGVDSSPALPPPPRGIAVRAAVPMESLPFADGGIDAVASQFGYEYGDTGRIALELARVLAPGGRLRFIVHRSDGPIVAHNLPRRDALRWALAPGGYLAKARGLLAARRIAPIATPPAFREAPREVQRLFPNQSVGGEFLEAVFQTLEMGRGKPVEDSVEVLDSLEKKARNEIARIDTLERSACGDSRIEALCAELRAAGLEVDAPSTVQERSAAAPFAWLVSGSRLSGRGTSR
jgi:SAM-dependent methyltransferase